MDFEFSDEQEALRGTVRRFLADKAPLSYVRELVGDARGTTDGVWKGLAGLGVTGLLVPAEHGGAGMGTVDMGVVLEELGRMVHPGPFLSSAVTAVSVVARAGTPDDAARLLPGLGDGSIVGTLALLEAGRRYDWMSPATRAAPDGGGWRVTGTKVHVADAVAADVVLVAAATDDDLGLFAVDAASDGVSVEPSPTVDVTRREATVGFDRAAGRRLGTGDATDALAEVVDRTVVAHVVDGVGAASAALDLAVGHAKERVQFDRPIGSFQAVQHRLAEMLQLLELGRAGAYYALWACDAADAAERHRAATMAKAFAADAYFRVGAGAIQVFGGIGFTWEHDAHLFYKRLLTLQHVLGGTPEHLEELARLVL